MKPRFNDRRGAALGVSACCRKKGPSICVVRIKEKDVISKELDLIPVSTIGHIFKLVEETFNGRVCAR